MILVYDQTGRVLTRALSFFAKFTSDIMRSYNFNLYEKENVMITLTNEFTNEMNELKKLMVEKMTDVDTIRYMSADELLLTQKMLNFVDLSVNLMREQYETINKIELMLERLERNSGFANKLLREMKKED